MNFLELAALRQSDREYLDQPVEPEKIERCLEAARLAPSACNAQPWHVIVVADPSLRAKLAQATYDAAVSFNRFADRVPVFLVVVTEAPNLSSRLGGIIKNRPYHLIDIGIVAAHICLQAAADGLGTCMMGWFNESRVKHLLGVPHSKRVDLIIALGYPAKKEIRPKIRKDRAEMSSHNQYKK